MSIIYEALKKTEKILHADLKTGTDTKQGKIKSKIKKIAFGDNFRRFSQWCGKCFTCAPQEHTFPYYKIIALYVIMIFIGLVIGNFVIRFLNQPAKPKAAKITPPPAAPLLKEKTQAEKKVETIAQVPVAVKKEPEKSFVLNGIFFSRDEGYALINNQIVKMGDTVDGATVLRIAEEEVELNSSGTSIKLTRPR